MGHKDGWIKRKANGLDIAWNKNKTKKDFPQLSNSGVKSGNIPWNKGKFGYKTKPASEERKRKISYANKGKSKILWENPIYRKKNIESRLGKKLSEETKRKMSLAHKGEKSYLWQGGKSFEEYGEDWTNDLKESIRKRDEYACQMEGCGIHQDDRAFDKAI